MNAHSYVTLLKMEPRYSSKWLWGTLGLISAAILYSISYFFFQPYPVITAISRWLLLILPLGLGMTAHYRAARASGGRVRDTLTSEVIFSLAGLILALYCMSQFLAYNEAKVGPTLVDPILSRFEPVNVAWLTFTILYAAIISSFGWMFQNPKRLAIGLQSYTMMMFFRGCAMYLVPLDAPASIIVLTDPIIEFFGDQSKPLVKDLFFSGHTATLTILYLNMTHPVYRKLLLAALVSVASCVIIQHVHYSIDVFSAPFFAYGAYRTVIWAHTFRRKA